MSEAPPSMSRLLAVIDSVKRGDLASRCGTLEGDLAPVGRALDEALDALARDLGQVATAAAELGSIAERIEGTVRHLVSSAATQAQAVAEIGRKLQALGARSEEVGQIVELLDDVAAETNILALNAAIEASRAGTQGKGFGMVADEVRKLAERSAAASKDIGAFIQLLDASTGETSRALDGVRSLGDDIGQRASQTAQTAGRLAASAHGVWQILGRFRVPAGREADLVKLLRERRSELERAMGGLGALIDDPELRPVPVAQALRGLRSALSALDEPGSGLPTDPHAG